MKDQALVEFILDQLDALGGTHARAMFGGHGLYAGGVFFGIVYAGKLYFRTDASTSRAYIDAGMPPFTPRPGQTLKHYFQVPVDVIENDTRLVSWAKQAVEVGSSVHRPLRRKTGRRKRP
jgi:DNA transformation protein